MRTPGARNQYEAALPKPNIGRSDLAPELTHLGLNTEEAEIYIALVFDGILGPSDLSERTSAGRTKIYAIVDRMVSSGWVRIAQEKPRRYVAVSPREVIVERKKLIDAAATLLLDELGNAFDQSGASMSEIKILRGGEVHSTVRRMIEQAQHSILIVSAFPPTEEGRTMVPAILAARDRGTVITIVMNENMRDMDQTPLGLAGLNIRYAPLPGAGFVLVDEREILFGSREGDEEDPVQLGVWTTSPTLIQFNRLMFTHFISDLE